MSAWNVGDIVRLKSGGPRMTVEDTGMVNTVVCVWFVGTKVERNSFPVSALERADK